jgi:hypothetical protein
MAFGIEIFNQAGLKVLGIDDRCPRYHSTITIPALDPGGSILVAVSGMTTDGTWFADTDAKANNVEAMTWSVTTGGVLARNCMGWSSSSSIVLKIFRG